ALNAGRAARIAVYSENLDLVRSSGPRYEEILKTYLREKYRDRPIGVIATIGPAALSFMLRARPELWPDVPAIFASVDPETAAQALGLGDSIRSSVDDGDGPERAGLAAFAVAHLRAGHGEGAPR